MNITSFEITEKKVIIRLKDRICESSEELLRSNLFKKMLKRCVYSLRSRNSLLLDIFPKRKVKLHQVDVIIEILLYMTRLDFSMIPKVLPEAEPILRDRNLFSSFIEYFYNYWRSFDRFIICDAKEDRLHKRPYRTFDSTIEQLTHLVRQTYRDIHKNVEKSPLKIFRQVFAGAEVGAIARPIKNPSLEDLDPRLKEIAIIRQVLMYPPLILETPMNKREGTFQQVDQSPLEMVNLDLDKWLCYPARVGELLIFIYFHRKYYELGFSLCNLFEMAEASQLKDKPDAIYFYGVDDPELYSLSDSPTVFFDDRHNDMLIAAVPGDDNFGYFGYLKKMVLTLHNIIMLKRDKLPFHGALVTIVFRSGNQKTILLIGDSGAGKSESLEALRIAGKDVISEMIIVADDMGSIEIQSNNSIRGYGTEIGAFLRLDDLQPGYAFGQLDRAIIMNTKRVNARIIIPVSDFHTVIKGTPIDFIFYANNYEEVDDSFPLVELFDTPEEALGVFREGKVMSKGTTTSTGIVSSYFANIFGPPQFKKLHEKIAEKYFKSFFKSDIVVGQIRTRLGLPGWENEGPIVAATEMLELLQADSP